MDSEKKLVELRNRIDALDEQLQSLISARAECAAEVARVKIGQGEDTHFYRPEREAAILRAVSERNAGPLPNEEMVRLFREIMSACLALEKPLTIAYLGPEGTFTQAAVLKQFGHSVQTLALDTLDDVFREVASGAADYGVVPVENSTEGVISHTLDLFQQSRLNICGEVELRIHHHLLVKSVDVKVTRVLAHQQALAQCRGWLEANLPDAVHVAVGSNAEAARLVSEDDSAAAIASDMAAELYQLAIKERNIEDHPDNTTRFLIIGREEVPASGNDKSSILVSMRNKPGALYQLLEPFHKHGLSLTRIETRPSPSGTWAYVFYIDFEGHVEDAQVSKVLSEIDEEAVELKRLGSYPIGVL